MQYQKTSIRPTEILFIASTSSPNMGGSEVFTHKLLTYASQNGIKATLIGTIGHVYREAPFRERVNDNYTIYRLRVMTPITQNRTLTYFLICFPPLLIAAFFHCIIRWRKITVIQTNEAVAGLAGMLLGKLFGIKSVCIAHGVKFKSPQMTAAYGSFRRAIGWVYRHNDVMLATGDAVRQELLELGVSAGRIVKYTHWIALDQFHRVDGTACRKALEVSETDFLCLYVGRLFDGKGIALILEAATALHAQGIQGVKFAFLGNGEMEDNILSVMKQTNNIICVKRVPHDELPAYYSAANVSLAPTTWHGESYNLCVMEAIACGCPVIASRTGGLYETLHMDGAAESNVGISLRECSSPSIQEAILKLRNDRALHSKLSGNCEEYARTYFSPHNIEMVKQAWEAPQNPVGTAQATPQRRAGQD